MKLTTAEAKKRHSFNYFEYFVAQIYYQCNKCATIVEPKMRVYCPECVEELDPKNKQQLFCCECKKPIIHKSDYFINDKHLRFTLPCYLLSVPMSRKSMDTIHGNSKS